MVNLRPATHRYSAPARRFMKRLPTFSMPRMSSPLRSANSEFKLTASNVETMYHYPITTPVADSSALNTFLRPIGQVSCFERGRSNSEQSANIGTSTDPTHGELGLIATSQPSRMSYTSSARTSGFKTARRSFDCGDQFLYVLRKPA